MQLGRRRPLRCSAASSSASAPAGVALDQMPDQRGQPLVAGRAQHAVDVGHGDPARREGQQLLQQRLAVAHRAGRAPGEHFQRLGLGLDALRPSTICRSRSAIEPVRMPAKSNRWQRERIVIGIFVGFGRAEDELHVLGRLFERLQQGVEGLAREHVDFVDDVDLEPRRGWAAR